MIARFSAALLVAATLLTSVAAHAGIDEGIAAMQQGKFSDAKLIFEAEAEKGNAVGEFMLGVMNEQGFGIDKNVEEAIEWYRRAADRGMGSAAYNLSRFYQNGEGVERNMAEAVRYLTLAAEKGHGRAMHNLGRIHESDGLGEPDLAEALKWYSAAATYLTGADRAVAVDTITALHERMTGPQIQDGDARYNAWIADHPPPNGQN